MEVICVYVSVMGKGLVWFSVSIIVRSCISTNVLYVHVLWWRVLSVLLFVFSVKNSLLTFHNSISLIWIVIPCQLFTAKYSDETTKGKFRIWTVLGFVRRKGRVFRPKDCKRCRKWSSPIFLCFLKWYEIFWWAVKFSYILIWFIQSSLRHDVF